MTKKVVVENECDGCGFRETVNAQKNFLGFIKNPKLATGWKIVKDKEFCPACFNIYQQREGQMWNSLLVELKNRLKQTKK